MAVSVAYGRCRPTVHETASACLAHPNADEKETQKKKKKQSARGSRAAISLLTGRRTCAAQHASETIFIGPEEPQCWGGTPACLTATERHSAGGGAARRQLGGFHSRLPLSQLPLNKGRDTDAQASSRQAMVGNTGLCVLPENPVLLGSALIEFGTTDGAGIRYTRKHKNAAQHR